MIVQPKINITYAQKKKKKPIAPAQNSNSKPLGKSLHCCTHPQHDSPPREGRLLPSFTDSPAPLSDPPSSSHAPEPAPLGRPSHPAIAPPLPLRSHHPAPGAEQCFCLRDEGFVLTPNPALTDGAWRSFRTGHHWTERSLSMAREQWLHVFMGFKHNRCTSGTLHPPNKSWMKPRLRAACARSTLWECLVFLSLMCVWDNTHTPWFPESPECFPMCANMSRKPGTSVLFSLPPCRCACKTSLIKSQLQIYWGQFDHYGVIRWESA